MRVKIPFKDWEVFSTTYAAPVKCPRCGQVQYVHISEYGEKYKKYFPENEYSYTDTDYCDFCGEQLIVEMVKPNTKMDSAQMDLGVWYDIEPTEYGKCGKENYENAIKLYVQPLGEDKKCGNVILYENDGWNHTILHCAPIDVCMDIIDMNFNILWKSEDQSIPIKGEGTPLKTDDIEADIIYMIVNKKDDGVLSKKKFAIMKSFDEDVFVRGKHTTEPFLKVILYGDNSYTSEGDIVYCGSMVNCRRYLQENFHVIKYYTQQIIDEVL